MVLRLIAGVPSLTYHMKFALVSNKKENPLLRTPESTLPPIPTLTHLTLSPATICPSRTSLQLQAALKEEHSLTLWEGDVADNLGIQFKISASQRRSAGKGEPQVRQQERAGQTTRYPVLSQGEAESFSWNLLFPGNVKCCGDRVYLTTDPQVFRSFICNR